MDENEAEAIVSNLVVHGGDAKSFAIEAIEAARKGNFAQADDLLRLIFMSLVESVLAAAKQGRSQQGS